jgi:hypothetical protein
MGPVDSIANPIHIHAWHPRCMPTWRGDICMAGTSLPLHAPMTLQSTTSLTTLSSKMSPIIATQTQIRLAYVQASAKKSKQISAMSFQRSCFLAPIQASPNQTKSSHISPSPMKRSINHLSWKINYSNKIRVLVHLFTRVSTQTRPWYFWVWVWILNHTRR